ncbi:MAG: divergent polysaccharide deacetylase family protein [Desulfovibrionaceae bacterium]|nr:divergent polysaccharide deacetylase family protein [Desulfovibrionaceae bacterium]
MAKKRNPPPLRSADAPREKGPVEWLWSRVSFRPYPYTRRTLTGSFCITLILGLLWGGVLISWRSLSLNIGISEQCYLYIQALLWPDKVRQDEIEIPLPVFSSVDPSSGNMIEDEVVQPIVTDKLETYLIPFSETVNPELTDLEKRADFAIWQVLKRFRISSSAVMPIQTVRRVDGESAWMFQRMRIMIPVPVRQFVAAVRESLEAWAEGVNMEYENGEIRLLFGSRLARIHVLDCASSVNMPDVLPTSPKMVVVLEKIGTDPDMIAKACSLGIPFTAAVLPSEKYAQQAASLLYEKGWEILIQQPMQSSQFPALQKDSDMCLTVEMQENEMRDVLQKSLRLVPHASGLYGTASKVTGHAPAASRLSQAASDLGCFVIDTDVSRKSFLYNEARMQGISVFRIGEKLDAGLHPTAESILKNLQKAELRALQGETVIVGCRISEHALEALRRWIPARHADISCVPFRAAGYFSDLN